MKVTKDNNFCRVFELPESYPRGFLFGGGKQVNFLMVDWFNPVPQEYIEKEWSEVIPMLKEFLKGKQYVRHGRKYLLITDFDESFIVEKGTP